MTRLGSVKRVFSRLNSPLMMRAINDVWHKSSEKECTLRTAAFILGCERILKARKERGIFPG
ncbi:hypothetical protein CDG55_09575 [Acinetobacter sp. WCHA45]|nr:hypothetical protein CDG55_09575 [Acinetobacter sp. WCHA45]